MADKNFLPDGAQTKPKNKIAALAAFLFKNPKRRLITCIALAMAVIIGVGTPILVWYLTDPGVIYRVVKNPIPVPPEEEPGTDDPNEPEPDPGPADEEKPGNVNHPTNPDEEEDRPPHDLGDPETDDKEDEDNEPVEILDDGSLVYDVNDYNDITAGVSKLKLTIQNDVTVKQKELVIKISEEGEGYKFQKGDCLEYDMYMVGSLSGAGAIDLVAADGAVRLRDQETAQDRNGVNLMFNYNGRVVNQTNQISQYAANRWYRRVIPIPDELIGKSLTYWAVVSENHSDDARSVIYFDNIQLTDGKGHVHYTAYANGNLKKAELMSKIGIKDYALDPELVFPRTVSAKGDAFEVSFLNEELANGKRATAEILFSKAGSGKYSLCEGDSILYKIKNMDPLIAGSGAVDIRFTDGTYLSDYSVLDQNGYAVGPKADLSGISYGDWLYRKIDVTGNLVGKVIDYWCVRADNAASGMEFSVMVADVKVVHDETTQVLAYGGGKIDDAQTVAAANTTVDFGKHVSSANSAKPAGNILQVLMGTNTTGGLSSFSSIWQGSYTIQKGDCLEYDLRADPDSSPAGGFGIDIVLAGGTTVRYGLEDQNGYSAGAGTDISRYTSNRWYHRRIDLSSLAGETLESLNIGGAQWLDTWFIYAYFDNIRVTNRNETVLDVFTDDPPAVNELYNQQGISSVAVASVPYTLEPLNTAAPVTLPTKDVPIMTFNVRDFGAKGDGVTDDTNAFQGALFAAERLGGGIVFAPAGKYAIQGNLLIPRSVTLRGDWQNPEQGGSGKGTILYAYAGKGTEDGFAFISMSGGSALTNISVYYPEQSAVNVQKYPWTIRTTEGMTSTIENVTLYNPYRAIHFGPQNTHHQYASNIFATPLRQGAEINMNFDMTRHYNIKFSSSIWQNAGLPGAPSSGEELDALKAFMGENCIGYTLGRIDGVSMYNITLSDMKTGIYFDGGSIVDPAQEDEGGAMGMITGLYIDRTRTGLDVGRLNNIGMCITEGHIRAAGGGEAVAVQVRDTMQYGLSLQKIDMESTGRIAVLEGGARISFQNCAFESWAAAVPALDVQKGLVIVEACAFNKDAKCIRLASTCSGGVIGGNTFAGTPQIENNTLVANQMAIDTQTAVSFDDFGDAADFSFADTPRPANDKLFVIDADKYGDGKTEAGDAIRQLLADAKAAGGGTVYLPAGKYRVEGRLTVPEGVQLAGAATTPMHTEFMPTILQIFDGRGQEGGEAFITLEKNAGVSGCAFHHFEQTDWDITPYPFVIRGTGEGVYVRNISFVNAYQGIDFGSYKCDRHLIENVNGLALKTGLFVGGGSSGGTINTTHFNPHYWSNYTAYGITFQNPNIFESALYNSMLNSTTTAVFGDLRDENVMMLFTFAGNTGLRFIDQGQGGAQADFINLFVDGAANNLEIWQAKDINMVSPYLYAHYIMPATRTLLRTKDTFTGTVSLFNGTGGSGGLPTHAFFVEGGTVNITQFEIPTGAESYTLYATGGQVKVANVFSNPAHPWKPNMLPPVELYTSGNVELVEIDGWVTAGYAFRHLGTDGEAITKQWIIDNSVQKQEG